MRPLGMDLQRGNGGLTLVYLKTPVEWSESLGDEGF